MAQIPSERLTPRESITLAARVFGAPVIVYWCEELLAGHADDMDPRYPDITWLRGTAGWPEYWSRVWGARGLLHLGVASPTVVRDALCDPAWRVREMTLKVITRHRLSDPDGHVDSLVADPNERVRAQAWRALGLPHGGSA